MTLTRPVALRAAAEILSERDYHLVDYFADNGDEVANEHADETVTILRELADELEERSADPEDTDEEQGRCPSGECMLGMCGGTGDRYGPCGGCCGCLSVCLDEGERRR